MSEHDDKNNRAIQFVSPIQYKPEQVEAGKRIAEIITNPVLPEGDKKAQVWDVLNNATPGKST